MYMAKDSDLYEEVIYMGAAAARIMSKNLNKAVRIFCVSANLG